MALHLESALALLLSFFFIISDRRLFFFFFGFKFFRSSFGIHISTNTHTNRTHTFAGEARPALLIFSHVNTYYTIRLHTNPYHACGLNIRLEWMEWDDWNLGMRGVKERRADHKNIHTVTYEQLAGAGGANMF